MKHIAIFTALGLTACDKPATPDKSLPRKPNADASAAQHPTVDNAPTSISNSELLLKQFFPDGVRLGADLAFVAAKRPTMHRDDGADRNNVTRFSEGQGDWDRIDTIHYLFIDGVLRGVIREIGTVRKDPENA